MAQVPNNLNTGTQGMNIQRGPAVDIGSAFTPPNESPKPVAPAFKKPDKLTEAYDLWKKSPSKENMGRVVREADSIINNAMTSYSGGVPVRSQAKVLVSNAVRKFDPNKGTKLSTYLHTQLQPLQRVARKRVDIVRVPERTQMELEKLRTAEQEFIDTEGREPADSELSDQLGISLKRIKYLRQKETGTKAESLYEPESEEATRYSPGVSRKTAEEVWVDYVHHDLGPIDQKILEWRTGYNGKEILSNNEIARKLKMTPAAVSQRAGKIALRLEEGARL